MRWYTIHHLLSHHSAKSGYKFGIHILPVSKLRTKLIELLLQVRINGTSIACVLHKSRHVVLRLRDQAEEIISPFLELGRRHHSLLSRRLLHPLIGTRWTNDLRSRMGRTVHLILRRLHGWGSKHVHGSWSIRRMLGAET